MVAIHDNIENAFVSERMSGSWLGFRRQATDTDWYWTDHTPVNYTNWCSGEPHGDGERFAWLSGDPTGCWSTASLEGLSAVVCKVPEQD